MENLIELKKIAKEIYQLYILLIHFIEKNDKENIFELSKKINEYKSKEEEILATLDEKTLENLYNYALDNIEENNSAYLDKLYFFIINYYNTNYFYEEENNVVYARANAYAYSYKKIFNVLLNDTLDLKKVDSKFFENMKKKLYPCFFADVMLCSELEELLLSANFDLNNVVYTDCNEENIKNETMNLILYAEGLNDIVFDEDNTLKTLKRKYLFEYLVNNLDYEDFLDIKDYLYSLKKCNFTISEFKKVIEERGKAYGR